MDVSINNQPAWFKAALSMRAMVKQLEVNGCVIAFRQWGKVNNPPVVLVHGGRAHSRWWDHVAPMLASECFVSAVDLSGHGDSGHRQKYRWADWADEIFAIATEQTSSTELPVVVAHSMGARAAVKAAAAFAEQLKGLILIDAAPGTPLTHSQRSPQRTPHPSRIYSSMEEALSRFRLVPAQPVALPYVLHHIARTSIRQIDRGWTWKFDPQTRDREGEVGIETLSRVTGRLALVRGEHGRVSDDMGAWFERVLGRPIPVVDIPLAHHHVMMDQPLSLVRELRLLLGAWDHVGSTERST